MHPDSPLPPTAYKPAHELAAAAHHALDRFKRSLAQQLIVNRPPHADLAMDTPDRELDLLCIKRSLSGKNMLIDAVDQRAIEVEQKGRFDAHYECSSLHEITCGRPDRNPATAEQD